MVPRVIFFTCFLVLGVAGVGMAAERWDSGPTEVPPVASLKLSRRAGLNMAGARPGGQPVITYDRCGAFLAPGCLGVPRAVVYSDGTVLVRDAAQAKGRPAVDLRRVNVAPVRVQALRAGLRVDGLTKIPSGTYGGHDADQEGVSIDFLDTSARVSVFYYRHFDGRARTPAEAVVDRAGVRLEAFLKTLGPGSRFAPTGYLLQIEVAGSVDDPPKDIANVKPWTISNVDLFALTLGDESGLIVPPASRRSLEALGWAFWPILVKPPGSLYYEVRWRPLLYHE